MVTSSLALLGLAACGRRGAWTPPDAASAPGVDAITAATPAVVREPTTAVEFEQAAQRSLTRTVFEFVRAGKDAEVTLRRNRTALDELRLCPRTLVDVRKIETGVELFGEVHAAPILLAPTGFHNLLHPEAELETARGANQSQMRLVVSTLSHKSVTEIAKVSTAALWFQLYAHEDQGVTKGLVQLADAAGCRVLVITVDNVSRGTGKFKSRGITLPILGNLVELGADSGDEKVKMYKTDLALTWDAVERISTWTKMPVVLKGVISPAEVSRASESGFIKGLIVSNHGGRIMDGRPAGIEMLPRIVEAAAGRLPILMDGGVRWGTDVVKALALGARAVLIGRPYLWALAVGGAAGMGTLGESFRGDLVGTMAMCGATKLAEIGRELIWT